jgi:hypothetical protein
MHHPIGEMENPTMKLTNDDRAMLVILTFVGLMLAGGIWL